jgi:hypothetical protein
MGFSVSSLDSCRPLCGSHRAVISNAPAGRLATMLFMMAWREEGCNWADWRNKHAGRTHTCLCAFGHFAFNEIKVRVCCNPPTATPPSLLHTHRQWQLIDSTLGGIGSRAWLSSKTQACTICKVVPSWFLSLLGSTLEHIPDRQNDCTNCLGYNNLVLVLSNWCLQTRLFTRQWQP